MTSFFKFLSLFFPLILLLSCVEKTEKASRFTIEEKFIDLRKNNLLKNKKVKQREQKVLEKDVPTYEKTISFKASKKSANKRLKGGDISLDFENVTLEEFLKTLVYEILDYSYVSSVDLNQRISVHLKNVSEKDLIEILREILNSLGYYVIVDFKNRLIKIFKSDKILVSYDTYIVVYEPQYVKASELVNFLKDLQIKDIKVANVGNKIVLIGPANTVKYVHNYISQIDTLFQGRKHIAFVKTSLDVKKVEKYVKQILSLLGFKKGEGIIKSMPDINTLVIVTNDKRLLQEIKAWIRAMEKFKDESEERIYTMKINFLDASKVAEFLSKIDIFNLPVSSIADIGASVREKGSNVVKENKVTEQVRSRQTNPNQMAKEQVSPPNEVAKSPISEKLRVAGKISVDEETNTLIIMATPAQYEIVESLIKKLDVPPPQALIEMVVAEVSVGNSLNYGLEALFKGFIDEYPFTVETSFGLRGNATGLTGFKALIFGKNADIRGILNFLSSKTELNILSTPYILVKNREEARIEIGAEVPVVTELLTTSSGGVPVVTTSVQYRPTGIILKVTPNISSDNVITLNIEQEVSDAIPNTLSPEIQSPIITKRSAKTSLILGDGQVVLLGGLIQNRIERNKKEVPGVAKVPILGNLFKTENKSRTNTELIILIKAHVIRNMQETASIRDEMLEKLDNLQKIIRIIKSNKTKNYEEVNNKKN